MDGTWMARGLAIAGLLAGLAGPLVPDEAVRGWRSLTGDLVAPSLSWVRHQLATNQFALDSSTVTATEATRLAAVEHEARTLAALLERAHERSRPATSLTPTASEPLYTPVLLSARVLGEPLSDRWRTTRLLDQGQQARVYESALVLSSELPLLDLGRDYGIEPENMVLVGRAVVGKVAQVGRWSSTLVTTCDKNFRARAQLARSTAAGWVWGPFAMVQGDGAGGARLEGLSSADVVAEGDRVYLAQRDGILPDPLLIGQVVSAELDEQTSRWKVAISPALRPQTLTDVVVLRTELNAVRGLAAQ